MDRAQLLSYANNMLVLVVAISLPIVIAASVVGVLISIIQALTQVQEQTISFTVKLIAVFFVLYLGASWYGSEIFNFSVSVFDQITKVSQ